MIAFYIFTAIVGVGLLALGALGGDGGTNELELPGIGDASGSGADTASWKQAFSLRSISYFMAGFGATGSLLTLLGAGPALTLTLAGGMGVFAAGLVLVLFGFVRATEGGFGSSSDTYIGATGRVRVPIRPRVPGSVDIKHHGRTLTLRARALAGPGSDPSGWTVVVVVDVDAEQGILLVQPVDEFLTEAGEAPADKLPS